MEIFGKYLFGEDACWFINASKAEQRKWIAENTQHTDEQEIETFLSSKMISEEDECLNCKEKKHAGNISTGNAQKAQSTDATNTAKSSVGNSAKGQSGVKGRKD